MARSETLKWLKRLLHVVPDRAYIQLYYFLKFGRFCDLTSPSTYNEKLQWLKLHYLNPDHCKLVDKYEVKEFVGTSIGTDYVVPTLALYDNVDDIDFDSLPQSFVLKCTHDSEGVVLVRDKNNVDFAQIRQQLRRALAQNFFYVGREPHYKNIPARIIAEPFLEDAEYAQLRDYKFFCFDGEVKAMFIASDRSAGSMKFDYFDAGFNSIDVRQSYPQSATQPRAPRRYHDMIVIAGKLSRGIPHVRVDLYEVNGRVYFGEMTFFHFSGFAPFVPAEWDRIFGGWLKLPASSRSA